MVDWFPLVAVFEMVALFCAKSKVVGKLESGGEWCSDESGVGRRRKQRRRVGSDKQAGKARALLAMTFPSLGFTRNYSSAAQPISSTLLQV
jgi:hypothetical protein